MSLMQTLSPYGRVRNFTGSESRDIASFGKSYSQFKITKEELAVLTVRYDYKEPNRSKFIEQFIKLFKTLDCVWLLYSKAVENQNYNVSKERKALKENAAFFTPDPKNQRCSSVIKQGRDATSIGWGENLFNTNPQSGIDTFQSRALTGTQVNTVSSRAAIGSAHASSRAATGSTHVSRRAASSVRMI